MDQRRFVQEIFSRLTPEGKHCLFYSSLFDPSSWEMLPRIPELQNLDSSIMQIIKAANPKFYKVLSRSERRKNEFLRGFAYTGDMCLSMLRAAVKGNFEMAISEGFPDLRIRVQGEEKAGVEVKRLVSCSNFKNYLYEDIVKPLKEGKWKRKVGLLFLFPQLENENPGRIQQLIEGFYALEDCIHQLIGNETKLLCWVVEKEHHSGSPHSFERLITEFTKWVSEHLINSQTAVTREPFK
jgi:hypothetical protein